MPNHEDEKRVEPEPTRVTEETAWYSVNASFSDPTLAREVQPEPEENKERVGMATDESVWAAELAKADAQLKDLTEEKADQMVDAFKENHFTVPLTQHPEQPILPESVHDTVDPLLAPVIQTVMFLKAADEMANARVDRAIAKHTPSDETVRQNEAIADAERHDRMRFDLENQLSKIAKQFNEKHVDSDPVVRDSQREALQQSFRDAREALARKIEAERERYDREHDRS